MTEINTTEVRKWAHTFEEPVVAIIDLCDALNEARESSLNRLAQVIEQRERAEKAEATLKLVRDIKPTYMGGGVYIIRVRDLNAVLDGEVS